MMDDFELPKLGGDDNEEDSFDSFGSERREDELLRSRANGRFVPGDAPRVPTGRRNPNNGHYTGPTEDVEFDDLEPDRVDEDLWETDRPAAALRDLRDDFEQLGDR